MLGADPTKVSLRAKKRGLPQARLCHTQHAHFTRVLTVLLHARLTPADARSGCTAREVQCLNPVTRVLPASNSLCHCELLKQWF